MQNLCKFKHLKHNGIDIKWLHDLQGKDRYAGSHRNMGDCEVKYIGIVTFITQFDGKTGNTESGKIRMEGC